MNQGLHHIEIYVSDLERSRLFWVWLLDLLGFKEFQSWDKGFSLILDQTYIVFVQTEDKHKLPEYHRCRTGLNHLAFWAKSSDQVDQVTNALREKSVEILYEEKHPNAGGPDYYAVYFEDPDRIKVELVAPSD
jgi:catechol 2,3-dioxygenase-like lactoylglutathione lyase family enzyme